MRSAHGLEADVWSLGCMLYTFLVGKPPFDTEAVKSTLNRVIHAEFDLPSHLSEDAKNLIKSLLKKNPKERLSLPGRTSSLKSIMTLLIHFKETMYYGIECCFLTFQTF